MDDRSLIIAGIDPGTTLGYAVLDLDGNIIEVNSSKLLDLGSVIRLLSEMGLPVITSTDKKSVPGFIRKLSRKLGARVISPQEDMLVNEKKELAEGFKTRNDHERDALASAVFAHRQVRPLLEKVDRYIERNSKQGISARLRRQMLLHGSTISIQSAVRMIESPTRVEKAPVKRVLHKRDFEKGYSKLLEKHEALKKETDLLRAQRDALEKKAAKKKVIRSFDRDASENLRFKDRKITSLADDNRQMKSELDALRQKLHEMDMLLLKIERYRVVRIVDDLGRDFEKKDRIQRFGKGDLIMVKNPAVASPRNLERLRSIADVVISDKTPKTISDFLIISPKTLGLRYMDGYALVEKASLDKALDKKKLFEHIVDEYRKRKR